MSWRRLGDMPTSRVEGCGGLFIAAVDEDDVSSSQWGRPTCSLGTDGWGSDETAAMKLTRGSWSSDDTCYIHLKTLPQLVRWFSRNRAQDLACLQEASWHAHNKVILASLQSSQKLWKECFLLFLLSWTFSLSRLPIQSWPQKPTWF